MKANQQRAMVVAPEVLANVRIVLVEPRTPANIGATARAMKTMGLSRLVMVRPAPWRQTEAAWYIAHGAEEVLEASEEYDELATAVAPLRLVAGTTNRRRRRVHAAAQRPDTGAAQLVTAAQAGPVGVLFGNEDTGLSSADLSRCSLILTIPSAVERPSLNLSHAVQVVAYELLLAAAGPPGPHPASLGTRARGLRGGVPGEGGTAPPPADLAPAVELEALYARILRVMQALGFQFRHDDPETFLASVRRCFGRAAFERRDVRTLHLILAAIERFARRSDADMEPQSHPPGTHRRWRVPAKRVVTPDANTQRREKSGATSHHSDAFNDP